MKYHSMEQLKKDRSYVSVKSNALIQDTRFSLSALEFKVFYHIIQKSTFYDSSKPITIDITEFCKIAGISALGANYANIKNAVLGLRNNGFWMKIKNEDGNYIVDKTGKPKEKIFSWISSAEISPGEGQITVELDPMLRGHLYNLTEYFTKLNITSILPMKSKYSVRLYELLKSYLNLTKIRFTVDELREKMLNRNSKEYPKWCNFHSRVIKTAINEINQYSELEVVYKLIKKGRSIEEVEFSIFMKNKLLLEITERKNMSLLDNKIQKDEAQITFDEVKITSD